MKFVKTTTLLITFCAMAFSSEARVNSLGGNAGYWPEDEANVSLFPATVNELDLIQVSGAGGGDAGGSATIIWGEETTWGFGFNGSSNDALQNDWFNLMWGNGTYGALFNLGMSSSDNGLEDDLSSTPSTMELGIGFGMDMDFGEIGVFFSNSTEDNGDDNSDNDGNGMSLGFNLRRAQEVWLFDNMLVNFSMNSGKDVDSQKDAKFSTMGLSADLFTELPTGEGVTAKFGMGFGYSTNTTNSGGTDEDDNVETFIELPSITLGVEAEVTDWAHVRFGLDHGYWLSYSDDDGTTKETLTGANNFDWNFGLGFDYGSFQLDMVISETIFNNPMHYVTGRNTTPLSSNATLTWSF